MSNKVLYRKYRSRNLDEIVGQDHIRDTLRAALKNNNLAHAYLFVGPKGVGKTSVARIIAFEANKKEYSDSGHIDIIEIDAASNRRIDEIRQLRDKIHIAPLESEFKIYIIDEVHMLTREAFNALLKTLEEPPSHVIFILATTEAHKVPETITSRTQKFIFKPIDSESIKKHIQHIASKENIQLDVDGASMIAKFGRGSLRDSIGLLDQLSSQNKKIDKLVVQGFLGQGSDQDIEEILTFIENGSNRELSDKIGQLFIGGQQPQAIAQQIIDKLLKSDSSEMRIDLIDKLLLIGNSSMPHIALEIELQRCALKYNTASATQDNNVQKEVPETKPVPLDTNKSEAKTTESEEVIFINEEMSEINKSQWVDILKTVKTNNNALYAILRMARVEAGETKIKLTFPFKFHATRFEDKKLLGNFRNTVANFRPNTSSVEVDYSPGIKPTSDDIAEEVLADETTEDNIDTDIGLVIDTFGGGEVVKL